MPILLILFFSPVLSIFLLNNSSSSCKYTEYHHVILNNYFIIMLFLIYCWRNNNLWLTFLHYIIWAIHQLFLTLLINFVLAGAVLVIEWYHWIVVLKLLNFFLVLLNLSHQLYDQFVLNILVLLLVWLLTTVIDRRLQIFKITSISHKWVMWLVDLVIVFFVVDDLAEEDTVFLFIGLISIFHTCP